MIQIVHIGGHVFGLESRKYSPALHREAKATPGMRWIADQKAWCGWADAVAACVMRLEEKAIIIEGELPPKDMPSAGKEKRLAKAARKYQVEGVRFLIENAATGALLADDMGLGKAQPYDSCVLTPSGWSEIRDLKVGDEVIGSNGQPTRVTGVFPQGVREVFEVTFTDGAQTRCCKEHLWSVQTPNDRARTGAYRTMSLEEIHEAGLVDKNGNRKWFTPIAGPAQFHPYNRLRLNPYVLGALLANGSLTRQVVHSGSEDQWAQLRPLLPVGLELRPHGKDMGIVPIQRGGLNIVREELYDCDLTGTYSHTKFVPNEYKITSPENRVALLQGLFDNDGTISKDGMCIEYNTTSEALARDVVFLVRSLGGVTYTSTRTPHYTYKGKRRKGRTDHRVRVSLPPGIVPFRLPRKVARFKPRTKYPPARAFESIRPAGKTECVCIRVEAEDQLYVTDDFIVTHNTSQALWTIGALERSALIVCPSFVRNVWVREAAKWLPKMPVTQLNGTKPKTEDIEEMRVNTPTLFLVHYDIVYAWVDPIIQARPEIVVFDECHFLMSDKSKRSLACRAIARATPYRIGLSGTPMTSRPRDLWNVVDTLSEGRFGRPFDFFLAHCDAHKETVTTRAGDRIVWNMTGSSRLEELKTRLDYFMLRRTKSDVELELPQRTRQVVEVEIKRECRTPIGSALKSDRLLREALSLAADGKLPKAVELIMNHIESGSKVVCFTHRKAIAELMATSLRANGVVAKIITGDVPQKRRIEIVDEQPTVLCCTMDSTQVGIDLTFADIAVFVELDWVPSKLAQCEARLHRFGQKRNVLIQYVIALSTADEVIADAVVAKLDVFSSGIGKLDDGLRETLGGSVEINSADQLRKLYEKLKEDSP